MSLDLDDPARLPELRRIIQSKAGLKDWYEGVYARWQKALGQAPAEGLAVELGSGAGFAKERLDGLRSTDSLPYEGLDQVADALALPWGEDELRAIFLLNVFHHLPDPGRFLEEAQRTLRPGGVIVISDEYPGVFGALVLRWLHHEPYDPKAVDWKTPVAGPLAGANGALAWMVFERDRGLFAARYPALELLSFETFAPLQYWVSGGLKAWSLAPGPLLPLWRALDRILLKCSPRFGSFVHIVIRKKTPSGAGR